jgi:hypothetical protein
MEREGHDFNKDRAGSQEPVEGKTLQTPAEATYQPRNLLAGSSVTVRFLSSGISPVRAVADRQGTME